MTKFELYKYIYNDLLKFYDFKKIQFVTSDIKILDFLIYIQYFYFSNINIIFIRKNRNKKGNFLKIEGNLNKKKILVIENLLINSSNISYIEKSLELKGKKIDEIFIILLNKKIKHNYNIKYFLEKNINNINDIEDKKNIDLVYKTKNQNLFNLYKKNLLKKIDNGFLFIDDLGKFIKFDNKFNIIWEIYIKNEYFISFEPLIIGEIIYIISSSGELYKIGLFKGNIINIYNICDNVFNNLIYSKDRDEIYIFGVNNSINNRYNIYTFNLKTKLINQFLVDSEKSSEAAYINNKIIYGTNDEKLNIFDFKKINSIKIYGKIIGGFEKINNNLIFSTTAGFVYIYDFVKNNIINYKKITNYWILTKPLVIKNRIYVTSVNKKMYILDFKLNIIENIKIMGRIFSNSIKISEELIFFGSNDSRGYLYNIKINKFSYYQFSERIIMQPIVIKNKLIIQDFLNNIYEIKIGKIPKYQE